MRRLARMSSRPVRQEQHAHGKGVPLRQRSSARHPLDLGHGGTERAGCRLAQHRDAPQPPRRPASACRTARSGRPRIGFDERRNHDPRRRPSRGSACGHVCRQDIRLEPERLEVDGRFLHLVSLAWGRDEYRRGLRGRRWNGRQPDEGGRVRRGRRTVRALPGNGDDHKVFRCHPLSFGRPPADDQHRGSGIPAKRIAVCAG